ncbi:hypothetical protein Q7P37_010053 [Cladosporium fusiforme]
MSPLVDVGGARSNGRPDQRDASRNSVTVTPSREEYYRWQLQYIQASYMYTCEATWSDASDEAGCGTADHRRVSAKRPVSTAARASYIADLKSRHDTLSPSVPFVTRFCTTARGLRVSDVKDVSI